MFLSGNLESSSQLSTDRRRRNNNTDGEGENTKSDQCVTDRRFPDTRGGLDWGARTVTPPLQVRDLHLQPGQHGQVLLLQEGDPSVHAGHLLLQPARIHGSASTRPAHRCGWMSDAGAGRGFSPAAVPVLMPLLPHCYNRHLTSSLHPAADNINRVVFDLVLILTHAKCLIAAPGISDAQPLIRAPWPTVIVKPFPNGAFLMNPRVALVSPSLAQRRWRGEQSRAVQNHSMRKKKALPLVLYALATAASQQQRCVRVA